MSSRSNPKAKSKPASKKTKETLPIIDIISMVDNPDGSATITFDYDERFVKWFSLENPNKKPTKKALEKFFVDMLKKACDKTDGYDIKKGKK